MNLLGDNISLPPIVPKSFHIMLTVFHPETLYGMKKWLPFCEDLRKQYKHTPTPVEYSILLVLQPPPIEGDVPAFTQALGDFPDFYMKTNSLISYYDQSFVRRRLSLHKKAETAIVLLDGNGNIKPLKNRSTGRIDPAVASIIAMAVWMIARNQPPDLAEAMQTREYHL